MKKIKVSSFSSFIIAIKHRKLLSKELAKQIHITCLQESITTQDIAEYLLPLVVQYQDNEKKAYLLEEFEPNDVEIRKVIETTNNEIQKEKYDFRIC